MTNITKQDFDDHRKEVRDEFKELRAELKVVKTKTDILTGVGIAFGAAMSLLAYLNAHRITIEEQGNKQTVAYVAPTKENFGLKKKNLTDFN